MEMILQKHKKKYAAKTVALRVFTYAIVIIGAFLSVYPLIFTLFAAFFSKNEFFASLTTMGPFPLPKKPTLDNFIMMFTKAGHLSGGVTIFRAGLNSLMRTVYSSVCAVFTSFLAGFVFNRLKFRGKNILFMALLATVMLPSTVTLVPTFLMYKRWPLAGGNMIFTGGTGIYNTFWVYLIAGPAINVMGTFIVMQSFDKIPVEMDEAAKIDGANTFQLLMRVLLPMQLNILTYILVTTAIATWNDWITPYYFTDDPMLITLPGAITKYSVNATGDATPEYPLIITLGLAITIPCLAIYFIFQRYIVEGLANAGIKG